MHPATTQNFEISKNVIHFKVLNIWNYYTFQNNCSSNALPRNNSKFWNIGKCYTSIKYLELLYISKYLFKQCLSQEQLKAGKGPSDDQVKTFWIWKKIPFKSSISQFQALHLAARKGDNDLVKLFIESGTRVDTQNVSIYFYHYSFNIKNGRHTSILSGGMFQATTTWIHFQHPFFLSSLCLTSDSQKTKTFMPAL